LKSGQVKRYVEPFVGGGAVFFDIIQTYNIEECYINDTNRDLILTYKVIQKDVDTLIDRLIYLKDSFFGISDDKRQDFYYEIREQFNTRRGTINYTNYSSDWCERAAELIFLNKTCFNGLYRVNSKGDFNVPFGKYKNPTIFDKENLVEVNRVLKNTTILCEDFSELEPYIDEQSFVYFDPPYKPLTASSSFTSYTKEDFGDEEQERLAEFYKDLIDYICLENPEIKIYFDRLNKEEKYNSTFNSNRK
jgi:DNA adenine methylase